ncbi:MAG: HD domain-containing protein [Candidatus Pacearchaeota archaeon]
MKLTQKQKEIIKQVHDFVKRESEKSKINDEIDIFKYHILNVVRFSEMLAEKYNANKFVVILASYLHDIIYIQTSNHETHEIVGAEFVKNYLSKFNIPEKEIALISLCVLNHRGSKKSNKESVEEKIIASADAMDHIDRCLSMLYRSGNKDFDSALEFMKGKLKRSWEKIELTKAREIVKPKYEAAKVLFEF